MNKQTLHNLLTLKTKVIHLNMPGPNMPDKCKLPKPKDIIDANNS